MINVKRVTAKLNARGCILIVMNREAANIFRQAAVYIRRYGWQKEGMGQDGLPRCSMGAIESAGPPRTEWDPQMSKLMYDSLYEQLEGLSLTRFNSKHQNGEAVAQLYEKVAARLEGNSGFQEKTA